MLQTVNWVILPNGMMQNTLQLIMPQVWHITCSAILPALTLGLFLTCPCQKIYRDEAVGLKSCNSSAECKKVVSDIFGKIEFLMAYENIGLYAHFALFSRFLALLFSKILSKMCSKSATYDPIAQIFDKCV